MSRARPAARYFVLGILLGGLGAAGVWHFYPGFWKESPSAGIEAAMARREGLRSRYEAAAPVRVPVQELTLPPVAPPPAVSPAPQQAVATVGEPASAPPPHLSAAAEATARPPEIAPVRARSDPPLQQLQSDLDRLQAQAQSVTRDPDGLRSRAERASQRRKACADDECLRRWYAQRRRELLEEF